MRLTCIMATSRHVCGLCILVICSASFCSGAAVQRAAAENQSNWRSTFVDGLLAYLNYADREAPRSDGVEYPRLKRQDTSNSSSATNGSSTEPTTSTPFTLPGGLTLPTLPENFTLPTLPEGFTLPTQRVVQFQSLHLPYLFTKLFQPCSQQIGRSKSHP